MSASYNCFYNINFVFLALTDDLTQNKIRH